MGIHTSIRIMAVVSCDYCNDESPVLSPEKTLSLLGKRYVRGVALFYIDYPSRFPKREAWKRAKEIGWTGDGNLLMCPDCNTDRVENILAAIKGK